MRRQHHCGAVNSSREIRYEIARIAADFFSGLVFLDRTAQLRQAFGEQVGNFPFIMGGTANLYQFQKLI